MNNSFIGDIILLPTNNKSSLFYSTLHKKIYYCFPFIPTSMKNVVPLVMYIITNEKIKENDYYYNSLDDAIRKNNTLNLPYHHKIALTTNEFLITSGVQKINDLFLKWFAENQDCRKIQIESSANEFGSSSYKIVIPKEEIKQTDEKGNPLSYWGGLAEHKRENYYEYKKMFQQKIPENITTDAIVNNVINKFKQRSETGIKKYGVTLDKADLSFFDWLNHLQEELMDATLYLEKLKTQKNKNNKQHE